LLVIVQRAVLAVPYDLTQARRVRPEVEAARSDDAPEAVGGVAPDLLARLESAVEPEDDPGGRADAADLIAVGGPAHPSDLVGDRLPAVAPCAHAEAPRNALEERDAVLVG